MVIHAQAEEYTEYADRAAGLKTEYHAFEE
jgi:hypothetical protein